MRKDYPLNSKTYKTEEFDSTLWGHYKPLPGDTVISTYAKCGTTWIQHIVLNLNYIGKEMPHLRDVSLWVERHSTRNIEYELVVEELIESMDRLPAPRQFKTHLPLDYLPYHPEVKYLVVARDMRDAYPSWHNHLMKTSKSNEEDIHNFWRTWVKKGIEGNAPVATEETAHPHFEFYHNWWRYKNLNNIHLVHFNNLLGNLESEIESIAQFLEIEIDQATAHYITKATTFSTMKENSKQLMGKANWMINKGVNGQWKEILTNKDIILYDIAKANAIELGISAECLNWLETGKV